jgi:uncharacterized repeat protein (TIGR01451 family)
MRFIDAMLALILGTALVATLHTQAAARVMAPVGQVDMSIGLDPPVSTVRPGERVIFNFRVENFSRVDARNLWVTVSLPQGFIAEGKSGKEQTKQDIWSNGFWSTCTVVDAAWPAQRVTCTAHYFQAGRYAYISIPARAPDAGWPLPLIGNGAVMNDLQDYELSNNLFSFKMEVQP